MEHSHICAVPVYNAFKHLPLSNALIEGLQIVILQDCSINVIAFEINCQRAFRDGNTIFNNLNYCLTTTRKPIN